MDNETITVVLALADKLPDAEIAQDDDGYLIILTKVKYNGNFVKDIMEDGKTDDKKYEVE
jgi:uncharacterized protein (DUF1499 family)